MDDSWFPNLKLTSSYETSATNYEPQGVPLEVSRRVNAQTLRFRQLEVRSDLSIYCALPGQYSFVFTQWLGFEFIAERTLSTSGFINDSLIYL